MANKLSAEMSTSVALDTMSASKSLSTLTTAVKTATNAWKANEAMLKSTGDYLKASEARYNGLGNAIGALGNKIGVLKQKQSELDTSTQDGAKAWAKYETEISKAQTQMASMNAQHSRAEQAMKLNKSGVLEMSSALKLAQQSTNAYVERLKAQGNETGATKAKISGLKEQQEKLSVLYKAQVKELADLSTATERDATAIEKQKIRVNETATAMAKAKTESNELSKSLEKAPSLTWTQKLKNNLMGVESATKKAGEQASSSSKHFSVLKGSIASMIGNSVAMSVMNLGSKLKEAGKEGLELAEQGEQTKRVWKDLGVSDKGIEKLSASMVDLRAKSGYSAGSIKQLQKQIYGMTGSYQAADKITKSIVGMGVASGLTEKQATKMGGSLARVFGSDSVTSTQLTRLEKQMPALGGALAKAAGTSKESFNSMITDGKVTGAQFEKLMEKVSKESPEMFKRFGKTGEGAAAQIKGSWTSLKSNMMAPLVSVKGSGIGQLSKAMQSKEMTQASKDIGKALSSAAKGLASFVGYAAKHSKDLLGIASSIGQIVKALSAGVWDVISGSIKSISGEFGKLSGNSKAAKDPIKTVNSALAGIAKHKQGIEDVGKVLIVAFVSAKVLSGIGAITGSALKLYDGLKLLKTVKTFSDLSKLKDTGSIVKGLGGVKTAIGGVKSGFGALKLAMMSNPFTAIAVAVVAIGVALVALYKHNAKFRNFVNGLGKSALKVIKNIVKWFVGLGKSIGKIFTGFGKWTKKGMDSVSKATSNGVNKVKKGWSAYQKWHDNTQKKIWSSAQKTWKSGWSKTKSVTTSGINSVKKTWNNLHDETGKIAKKMMKDHPKTFSAGYKVMQDRTETWKDITNGNWDRLGSDTKKTIKDMTKFWKSLFGEAYDYLNKITGGRLGDMVDSTTKFMAKISKGWTDTWNGIKGFFGSIWSDIKGLAKDGISGVVGFINNGISGIDTVIDFFGGKKQAISPIKLATGTMGGRLTQNTFAMLNDGNDSPQTGNQEMVHKKNGTAYLVNGRNTLRYLERGDAVLNATQTRQLLTGLVPHFANGTLWDTIKDTASGAASYVAGKVGDVGSWLGDKYEAIEKFFKNPLQEVTKVFDKYAGSISGSFGNQFGVNGGHYLVKAGEDWFKNIFKGLRGSMDNPAGTGVDRWKPVIEAVADRMHINLTSGAMTAILKRINQESGGDPNITNNWDSNAKAGHPSTGLLQFIQPTFDNWLPKGFANVIHNGASQIAAMFNNSNYLRDISVAGGWGPTGHKMMANGGLVSKHQMVEMAEGNKPEMVVPLDKMKSSRAWQLMAQVVSHFTNDENSGNLSQGNVKDSEELKNLSAKLDSLITLLSQMLQLTAAQTKTIRDTAFSKDQLYKQQALDQIMRDAQGF